MSSTERDRALGCLYGLAIGDALGMPTQQMPRSFVLETFGAVVDFVDGPPENRISTGMRSGTITDDTEQAIVLATTLIEGGGWVDPLIFLDRLKAWDRMASARGGEQLGPSTRRALEALAKGVSVGDAGSSGHTNGAAMRIAPVGIAFPPSPLRRLVAAVADASILTHNTGLAISGAAAVAAAVSAGVKGASMNDAIGIAVEAASLGATFGHYSAGPSVARRIQFAVDIAGSRKDETEFLDDLADLVGTSVATQESVPAAFALGARWPDDPWRACLAAANLGGDSDTIGAMVGAVLGAIAGYSRLPGHAVDTVNAVNYLPFDVIVDGLLTIREPHDKR